MSLLRMSSQLATPPMNATAAATSRISLRPLTNAWSAASAA